MESYCREHIAGSEIFCEKTNRKAPPMFCKMICRGNWAEHKREPIEKVRESARLPLTAKQKTDDRLVSVIIPIIELDGKYINRTIENLQHTAYGPIEILVGLDGFKYQLPDGIFSVYYPEVVGQRVIMNDLARYAKGEFLFRLDGHCKMSPEWDVRLKSSCSDNTIITTSFDTLKEDWTAKGVDLGPSIIGPCLRPQHLRGWRLFGILELESMVISGCAWLIKKDYYWSLEGSDEDLGTYGWIGTEWGLKTWLTGGRILVRADVVCYHLFRKRLPYKVNSKILFNAEQKLYDQWIKGEDPRIVKPYKWLQVHFEDHLVAGRHCRLMLRYPKEM